ncbi:helix-turn-helix domain-containing protein [Prevotella brunnea]|uniref:helix-turn-helix domain-containing protein n=1 Tax=Prevotella brunnea TaxID=2508867 RepID=UPI00281A62B9|nr:helix-turn-helix domain-containing protein [Prevotella brunnea]MDR0185338.1 helix-turn-helix domain-containing protein [Prevotella brunnea]
MKTLIKKEQKEIVVRLYRNNSHTIKQIMELTGVRSEQTIYRILSDYNIPKQRTRKPTRTITIGLDKEAEEVIISANPKNLSEFVSEMIKKGYSKG